MLGSSAHAHALMGCDLTGKMVTTHAVIKSDPIVYLGQVGRQNNEAQLFDIMRLAERYLGKLLKQGPSCTIWMTFTIASQETRLHIMRSIYATCSPNELSHMCQY